MDEKSTNGASVVEAGVYKSKRACGNIKVMQKNSLSYNFVSSSIKKASKRIDIKYLKIFNSYA